MRRFRILVPVLAVASSLVLAACDARAPAGEGCTATGNPLDAVLCEEFESAGYQPVRASDDELCTRIFVDLLGRRPTRAEIADRCAGREPYDVVVSLQRTQDYRDAQRRRWADRFRYSEMLVDLQSIKQLDAMVEDLYSHRIGYARFAEVAAAHPGFVGRWLYYGQPEMVAEGLFRVFLGRRPTHPEVVDLANLYRPWVGGGFPVDGVFASDVAYYYGPVPYIDPWACEEGVRTCVSTLLGHAEVAFPRNGREEYLTPDMLTDADRRALGAPGRLITTLPMFWEGQVDETLTRYLGYDLGALRPEARQQLVNWFRSTGGDLVRLERAVVTSWAYLQPAGEDAANPRPAALRDLPIAYGPTKIMLAENWLHSMGALVGRDVGDCDWRYPGLPDWYYPDPILDEILGDDVRYPKREDGTYDPAFRDAAVAMGGCPGSFDWASYSARERSTHMGLMTAVAQEQAIVDLCLASEAPGLLPAGLAPNDRTPRGRAAAVRHVLESAFGRPADHAEIAEFVDAAAGGCAGCGAETIAREACAAVAGGVEYIFY